MHVTFIGEPIDEIGSPKDGMVIDFADLKAIVKTHVVDVFDHALVLRDNSRFLSSLNQKLNPRLMLVNYQPTCENMLKEMVEIIQAQLHDFQNVALHSVLLRETQTSFAEWFASDNP